MHRALFLIELEYKNTYIYIYIYMYTCMYTYMSALSQIILLNIRLSFQVKIRCTQCHKFEII